MCVGPQGRIVIVPKQVLRIAVDRDAPGVPQSLLRKAAAQDADRLQARFARGFGIIRGIADHDGVLHGDRSEVRHGSLENVGVGLRVLRFIGSRGDIS
jgi:hypothetical protein